MRDNCYTRHEFQVRMINKIYLRICKLNPSYSLRQFAKYLKVSHATLSLILNGKRRLSKAVAYILAEKLELSVTQKETFLADYNENTIDELKNIEKYNNLDHEKFAIISEWQHFAILSLLETDDFRMDYNWIAERLGITLTLAKTSFARLIKVGMVEKRSGKWKQIGGPIRFRNTTSNRATNKFQEQLLKKSMQSLKEDPYEIRDHSLIVFTMDPSYVDYATNRIRQFRYELSKELESLGTQDEVYSLSVQLYPLTKAKRKIKKESA